MSWCGGGEISGTPGTEWRRRAIRAVTLCLGSWPPSPGFEPCAILISSSSALERYQDVTPKRAEATCLILLCACTPLRGCRYQSGSSPPSPLLLLAPSIFIPMASVCTASGERAPSDIAV